MFGVDSGELFLIVLVAVVVIGPKDLPRVMRTIGHWVGKARGMANQFRSGVDQMVRESEISDLEQKWREQNEAIMKAHPMGAGSNFASPPPSHDEPTNNDWGLGLVDEPGEAPVMKPLNRGAPSPPISTVPAKPTPPRLEKGEASSGPMPFPHADAAPVSGDLAKSATRPSAGRRPPRTVPGANLS